MMRMETFVAIVPFLVVPVVGLNYPNHNDASSVTWAHAVNTRLKLKEAMERNVDFLEADVSYGHIIGDTSEKFQPIMAHPPDNTSQLSLESWLDVVLSSEKPWAFKLDFKDIRAVKESLMSLQNTNYTTNPLTSNLWLNADILPGPVDATNVPVDGKEFLKLCAEYFPKSTLSVGWTTYLNTSNSQAYQYSWKHVIEMATLLKTADIHQPVTFPVRAAFVGQSIRQLQWLLDVIPFSSLTVWSGSKDPTNVTALMALRASLPRSKVYYDLLPKSFSDDFSLKRKEASTSRRTSQLGTCDGRQSSMADWLIESPDCAYPSARSVVLLDACHVIYKDDVDRRTPQDIETILEFLDGKPDDAFIIVFHSEPAMRLQLTVNGSVQFGNRNENVQLNDDSLMPGRCYRVKIHEPGPGKATRLTIWTLDCETNNAVMKEAVHMRLGPIGKKPANRNIIGFQALGTGVKVIQELNLSCNPKKNIGSTLTSMPLSSVGFLLVSMVSTMMII